MSTSLDDTGMTSMGMEMGIGTENLRFLVVDDTASSRKIVRHMLEKVRHRPLWRARVMRLCGLIHH